MDAISDIQDCYSIPTPLLDNETELNDRSALQLVDVSFLIEKINISQSQKQSQQSVDPYLKTKPMIETLPEEKGVRRIPEEGKETT